MNYIIPAIERGKILSGVYKMTFDESNFYIGSSRNLKRRFQKWKDVLKIEDPHNELILASFKKCSTIKFEILEIVAPIIDVRIKEDFYIKSNFGNPLLLNRSNDAFVSKFKRTPEQKERAKKVVQKVAQFNLSGELIEIFPSVKDAYMKLFGKKMPISKCFVRAGRTTGGFTFKKVSKDGLIIEPPVIPYKPSPKDKGYKYSEQSLLKRRTTRASKKISV